jgi:hypothetical protein
VNPEHVRGVGDDQRQNAIQLHRLTCCSVLTALIMVSHLSASHRAHSAHVQSGLSPTHLPTVGRAWCAAQDDDADEHALPPFLRPPAAMHTCQPYIDHMLSPSLSAVLSLCTVSMHCTYKPTLRRMPCLTCSAAEVLGSPCPGIWCALQMPLSQTPLTPPSSGPTWTKYPTSTLIRLWSA